MAGNRRMLGTGNIPANDCVALVLMDYPQWSRLKILGHARVTPAASDLNLRHNGQRAKGARAEQIVVIDVVGFDWTCSKYITPRYSLAEVQTMVNPLQTRISQLESALRAHGKELPELITT